MFAVDDNFVYVLLLVCNAANVHGAKKETNKTSHNAALLFYA